ncbi:unnamed protein product [Linum tenue]|uniref:Uncharacterized protein n=1 Tax=Linum tenue TaxID=586396 RepID=A0AAV0KTH1_9ROSI|nr:unnamed protein product [Linum tenue]
METGNMYARPSHRVPAPGGVRATEPDLPPVNTTQPPTTQLESP